MPQGRLNTIPEGSSAASDSVFADPAKKNQQVQQEQQQDTSNKERKLTRRDGIDEDDERERSGSEEADERDSLMNKELWVTQNGSMGGSLPDSESKV